MKKYEFSSEQQRFIERMRQPFAVCQFLDKDIAALVVSDGFCELFGFTDRKHLYSDLYRNLLKDVHPDDTAGYANAILHFGNGDGRLEYVYRIRKKDGNGYRIIRLTGDYASTGDGNRIAELWFTDEGDYNDETGMDYTRVIDNIIRDDNPDNAARYDYLTGLMNTNRFFELAEKTESKMIAQGGLPALLYIDLIGMKHFNHRYGFSEGDNLLRYFARLLGRIFKVENCCHIMADRFAVIADEYSLEVQLEILFQEWRQAGEDRHLPICVGIYPYRIEEVPIGIAYDRAKIACDSLKGTYSSSFNYYSNVMSRRIEKQEYILENFELALTEKRIQVYFQPIVRAVNGKICDEEALARWIDPVKGLLSPADFIPYLEDAGLIYKLDLYVLENVLEHIKAKEKEGFYIVPHSINLSRSDFDACDMVEEIRYRVDEAGVPRDRISIEITESTLGSDFDFMKAQVLRFQNLGFPVWMDDFGSGYSSLDVLQSIKFDLLKFDMSFVQKLDENDDGRIILTELMKMAMSLGIDTICEGVETEDQMRFLQEIGCSKLQGYYFSKPRPASDIFTQQISRKLTGYENPDEAAYYELLCGVNLYDVSVIAREEESTLRNTYNTLPMCIIEVKGDSTRFVRSNQSYRDFFMRFFGLDLSNLGPEFQKYDAAFMQNVVEACVVKGVRTFYDEKMADGSIVHSFARRIGVNPITGITAIAIAVLSIREPSEKLMVEQILAVIEQFGESMPGGFFIYNADGNEELLYANKAVFDIFGCENLEEFKELTGFTFRGMVHPDDYDRISVSITDQVRESKGDLDFVEYRIIRKDGEVRWLDDYGHYIEYDSDTNLYYVFISDITDKYEKAESDKALRAAVIEAMTKPYDSLWLIHDIATEKFELFRIDKETEHLIPANTAIKIEKFSQALGFYSKLVLEEDRQYFLDATTSQEIARNTEDHTIYSVPFRRVFEHGIRYYRLEFTKLNLPGGKTSIAAGFRNVDEEMRKELQTRDSLRQRAAVIEALTRPYDSVWLINDIETEAFELYRVDDTMIHILPTREALKNSKFSDAFRFYSNLVLEEDRPAFLNAVTAENIRKNTENKMIYSVPFRRVFEDGVRQYRIEFVRMDLDTGEVRIVGGFKNVENEYPA